MKYIEEREGGDSDEMMHISGTEARQMFLNSKYPPTWYMRKEISKIILNALKKNKRVFVK